MTCPVIFICYSHDDIEYKNALSSHLSVLKRNNLVEIWSDEDIRVGTSWKADIWLAIEHTDIAILLMTPSFLCSDFIMNEEVPRLLERRQSGLTVFPIVISPCLWDQDKYLVDLEIRPKDKEAVCDRPDAKKVLRDLAQEVAEIVKSKVEAAEIVRSKSRTGPDQGEKPARKRHLWASATLQLKLLVLAVVTLVLWVIAVGFTTRKHIGPLSFPPLSVTVLSARFLSPNEEEELGFNIKNESQPLNAKFSLIEEGSGSVRWLGGGVIFKDVVRVSPPEWRSAKVHCIWDMTQGTNYLGEVARLSLQGEIENQPISTQDLRLRVAPIPWIKKFKSYLGYLLIIFWSFFFVVWILKTFPQKRMAT